MGKRIIKKEKGEYYVYVYLDPNKLGKYIYGDHKFLHEPIYVGKGKRKRAYYLEGRNSFLRAKLTKIGKPVILLIAKQLPEKEALQLEKECIAKIGKSCLGKGPLCNFSDGGHGSSGYKLTEETKLRMSTAQKLQKPSEETKRKISASLMGRKGHPCSEETKRKMSEARKGKPAWWNKGKSAWNKGLINVYSEETKRKMSEAKKVILCKGAWVIPKSS